MRRHLLAAVPLCALVAAAIDTVLVRARFAYREPSSALFLQTCLLWLAFALLAVVPAGLWLAWRARARAGAAPVAPDAVRCAAVLAFCAIAPVLAHGRLDAFSDLGGRLAGLRQARPWLELLGVVLALAAVLFALARIARRAGPRRTAAVLSLGALAAGLFAGPRPEEPDPPDPAAAGKPNLLLLVWDTTRAQSLSIYGYDRATTPHLAQLAREALVYEDARSPSRYTLTSHLSMLTGVYPSDHGARMTRQRISPAKTPSVAATLRSAGYRTGAFVGTGVLTAPTGMQFGFERYDDLVDPPVCDTRAWALVHDVQSLLAGFGPPLSRNGQPHWFQDFFRPAGEVLERAARWIAEDDPRPWFCMINLYDVHWPYLPEPGARERWVSAYDGPVDGFHERSDTYPERYRMQPRDDAHLRELYDAELAELDARVERFLAGLDLARANTAVLVTADHGEAFGEGGRYEHNDVLEPQVHIPFLVRLPRATEASGRRVRAPVSGVDVAPTLLALAGLPRPAHYVGVDALALADADPGAPPRAILVEDRDQLNTQDVTLVLYRGTWKLVRRGLGEAQRYQLFDLAQDRVGVVDVAAQHPELVALLKRELDELRARWRADDVADQQGTGFSSSGNLDALKGLGYVEGGSQDREAQD